MTGITITHPFVSGIADGADPTQVQPSNWNASHTLVGLVGTPQGRLSLASATPVMTADVSGGTTVYWCLYNGNLYPWYNATNWTLRAIAELSLALDSNAGHTGYQQSGKNFDLFLYNNAGTDVLVTGPAWSSDTARGTGAGTTELQMLNGIWTNKNSMTAKSDATSSTLTIAVNQGTYVGTMRATANGQTSMVMNPAPASGGALCTLGLWNMYNRVVMKAYNNDNGTAYTYTSSVIRQARASVANQINFVSGLAEDVVAAQYAQFMATAAIVAAFQFFGFALDATTTFDTAAELVDPAASSLQARYTVGKFYAPQIGYHYVAATEGSDNVHAGTFGTASATLTGMLELSSRM